MAFERVFIDWKSPALDAAAEWLLRDCGDGETIDFSGLLIAVPGGRAKRRLLELLVEKAEARGGSLIPPEIVTAGGLPERLYEPKQPFADDLIQRLAWIAALQAIDREQLLSLVRQPPESDDLPGWLSLAGVLSTLHKELAADRLDFDRVVERANDLPGFDEADRWNTLAAIQQKYLATLDGLKLWDRQTARLFAVDYEECHTNQRIVLVGTVDLNRTQRAMLDQVADSVTALVFAPATFADRFDGHGCLLSEAWQEPPLSPSLDQVNIVDTPGDQADATIKTIAGFDGRFAAEQITVGVPDESLVPYLEQRFDGCQLPSRYGVGLAMSLTRPYRFLEAAAESLSTLRADAFAALARHPDLEHWLTSKEIPPSWLDRLDDHLASRLPARLDRGRLGNSSSELVAAYDAVSSLLEPLAGKPRPLVDWGDAVIGVLIALYGDREWGQDESSQRIIVTVCEKIAEAISAHGAIPASLMPDVTGSEAVRLVLSAIAGETIPPASSEPSIEFLGWLELPLDDADALIVTGFNEGLVPSSRNSDPFLPNALRAHLQLQDNDLRFARDAYALSVLLASRAELRIIGGRRTARNDPLVPSRLLFAGDENLLAQKTHRWFATLTSQQSLVLPGSLQPRREQAQFPIPTLPKSTETISSMRVTEFRDYLACPYRYFLKQRLKLKIRNDTAEELDGGGFGSLLHDVLQKFGTDDKAKAETDPQRIRSILSSLLDDVTRDVFGKRPLPAVRVQIELIRARLESFADWQAGWIAKGWLIKKVEENVRDEQAPFLVDGEPMFLRGRIDRVDVHRETGQYVVIDYKTGDAAKNPDQTHRKRDEWVDLQLPLYRYLLPALEIENESVALGYVVIPKDVSRTGERLADWTVDDLSSADETAEEVVRSIRRGAFGNMTLPPPAFFDEFAAICQDNVFGMSLPETEGEDEA
jgi:hypothetical protein